MSYLSVCLQSEKTSDTQVPIKWSHSRPYTVSAEDHITRRARQPENEAGQKKFRRNIDIQKEFSIPNNKKEMIPLAEKLIEMKIIVLMQNQPDWGR